MTKEQFDTLMKFEGEMYSKNLRAFLRHEAKIHHQQYAQKIVVARNKEGRLFIGHIYRDGGKGFGGCSLMSALGSGARVKTFCYLGGHKWPVIKNFWSEYLLAGVCAIDKEHTWYPERWVESPGKRNKTRKCKFCGLKQKRLSRKVTKTVHEWVMSNEPT